MAIDLSVKLSDKVTIKNPFVTAGGPTAGTVDHIKRLVDAGYGAVCTKTASNFASFQRYPRSRYFIYNYRRHSEDPYYADSWDWMHMDHNSQYPPEKFVEIVRRAAPYCKKNDCVLIGTFAAGEVDEWTQLAKAYVDAGAGALELNFCCPTPLALAKVATRATDTKLGEALLDDPEAPTRILTAVRKAVPGIPLYPKMPPTARTRVAALAKQFKEAGADGVTLYANTRMERIDIETGSPIGFGAAVGTNPGVMGDSIYDTMIVAHDAKTRVMGGRGARTWRDAVEFIMAGADGVQYSVAAIFYGPGYVTEMIRGLEQFCKRRGYKAVREFQGVAIGKRVPAAEIKEKLPALVARVVGKKCVGCGRCVEVCCFDGIELFAKGAHAVAKANPKCCVGCTLCGQVCREKAIEYDERPEEDYVRALFGSHPDLAPSDVKF